MDEKEKLEDKQSEFQASTDWNVRAGIIRELREKGLTEEADNLKEDWYQERHDWLKDRGADINQVLSDEDREYFMDEVWMEDSGEVKPVRLPDYLSFLP